MTVATDRLVPPPTKGHRSVVSIKDAWYVACRSRDLGKAPLARTVLGVPLALFRGADGRPGALLDRCPHRNVPLSFGRVANDNLQCGYHGWQFDRCGRCKAVPGLVGDPNVEARRAPSYATREQDGFVWVYPTADTEPATEPFRFEYVGRSGYDVVYKELEAPASVHAVVENALDVPHTSFLHGGLFRTDVKKNEIRCVVRRWRDRVEAEFIGEPRPEGLAAKLLSPSGGTVTHFDRFFLPSIVQVEYRIGDENHIVLSGAATPVSDFETKLYAVVAFRSRIPHPLVKAIVQPVALRIFSQDVKVLELQTATIERFGGEQYVHTEIDLLGPHIWRLMKQAAAGDLSDSGEVLFEKETRMLV